MADTLQHLDRFLDEPLTLGAQGSYRLPRQNLYRGEGKMKKLDIAALILVIVGALNWGLVALAEFDLVAKLVA
jgi:uncharacterized protein DUF378